MTPLVLLPGSLCDARLFGPQIAALGGRRPITVGDLTRDDTVAGMAHRVLADGPERFALAGLSMGGIVAMAVVDAAPERVERLARVAPHPCAERPERRAQRDPEIARMRTAGLASFVEQEVFPWFPAPRTGEPDLTVLRELTLAMAEACGPAVFDRQWRALRDRPDRTNLLRSFAGPTLLLCGAQDRLCPPDRHKAMATLMPGATLIIIPEAGHLATLEQPEMVSAALARWLDAPALKLGETRS